MQLNFIVGTGRCGSSLIHELLACHQDVGFISNFDDNAIPLFESLGRFNNSIFGLTGRSWTRKGQARFAPSEGYGIIGKCVSPIYADSHRDLVASDVTPWLASRFRSFFERRWRIQGKPLFLHKYTGWSRIGFFSEIFPNSRFVHVVRDGRSVANSWLQMPWWNGYGGPRHWRWGSLEPQLKSEWEQSGESYVALAGLGWRILMESYEAAESRIPEDRCIEIKYEDFLATPIDVIRRITAFLGLSFGGRLERAVAAAKLDSSRQRAYERELSFEQIKVLEQCFGRVLERHGYK